LDGKLNDASIQELLTGSPTSNKSYGYRPNAKLAGESPHLDLIGTSIDPLTNWIEDEETTFSNSGLSKPDIVEDLSNESMLSGESSSNSCPICFGSTYVGGYSLADG
jgi:hypothetical protein